MARNLFAHPDFELVNLLLHEMEIEAVTALRDPRGDPEEHVATIRAVDRLRSSIRALAVHAGVTNDPVSREI